uniref:MYND-type domain-containing protein n=1 Tax=Dracunculus medinensis TaxID=318479 RepID=A0A0N4U7Y6_DRAME
LVSSLLRDGANPNDLHHKYQYTPLMFAAISGKEEICRILMDAGAYADIKNSIGKTAVEMAALVGKHECVSVINSHIGLGEVERIVYPSDGKNNKKYPVDFVKLAHVTVRTHHIHPVKLVLFMQRNPTLLQNREKYLYVIDRIFERQLRYNNANEVLSVKLWIILFILRQANTFVSNNIDSGKTISRLLLIYAKHVLAMKPNDMVRPRIETILRNAIKSYPYYNLLLVQMLAKALSRGSLPGAYFFVMQALFGHQMASFAKFCSTCGVPDAHKCCCNCKTLYCSINCQKFDWHIHKKCCSTIEISPPTPADEIVDELDVSYSKIAISHYISLNI